MHGMRIQATYNAHVLLTGIIWIIHLLALSENLLKVCHVDLAVVVHLLALHDIIKFTYKSV